MGRSARAIHYPLEVRSYDKLKQNPDYNDNFRKNQAYVKMKYPDNRAVRLWIQKEYRNVNRVLNGRKIELL